MAKIKFTEAAFRRFSSKLEFLKISQYSQETTVLESLFNKVVGPQAPLPFHLR